MEKCPKIPGKHQFLRKKGVIYMENESIYSHLEVNEENKVDFIAEPRSRRDEIESILKVMGVHSMIVSMEELSDLSCKVGERLRGRLNKTEITQAVSDVYLVLEWITQYFRLNENEIRECCEDKHRDMVAICDERLAKANK
jgi:hypothetical protein